MKGIIKKIDRINFGLMSPEQIREMSVVKIERPDTYDEDGYPIESGLMDSRLGVIDPSLKCRTCGEKGGECQGHFGMIELARPVIHVGFGDDIHKILRSTCSECGRVLLDENEIEEYTERIAKSTRRMPMINPKTGIPPIVPRSTFEKKADSMLSVILFTCPILPIPKDAKIAKHAKRTASTVATTLQPFFFPRPSFR